MIKILLETFSIEKHSTIINRWAKSGEHQDYLSHLWPRYIRDNQPELADSTALYLIKLDEKYAGHCWLEAIESGSAKLGIFIAPEFRNQKIGQRAINLLEDIAFIKLKLKSIYLNVRQSNTRAINCYRNCGFTIISENQPKKDSNGDIIHSWRMSKMNMITSLKRHKKIKTPF